MIINPYLYGGGAEIDIHFGNVVSLLHFDNDTVDVKGKVWTTNGTGCAPSSTQSKFGGFSLSCPSSSGYLSTPTATDWQTGTVDMTIEGWFRIPDLLATRTIIGKWTSSFEWILFLSGNQINFTKAVGANITRSMGASANTWHHFAFTRASALGYFFLDGTLLGGAGQTCTNWTNSTDEVRIGSNSGTNFFNGFLDDLRVTKGVARYTATFTPPAQAYPNQ